MDFHKNILFYILIPATIMVVFISFHRFIINNDYIVSYEGVCDPMLESCFTGCADDECTEEYYYTNMQKYAADLLKECGEDITDCEEANICLPGDRDCSVIYCDSEIDEDMCFTLVGNKNMESEEQNDSLEEDILQDDLIDTNL